MKKEDWNETKWDKFLRIHTTGRDDSHADQYRYPYEPTPYPVLERLANTGLIRKGNTLLDYGCGKGRVDFSCLIRPDAGPSELNMRNESIRKHWKIRKQQYLPAEYRLNRPMQRTLSCRE